MPPVYKSLRIRRNINISVITTIETPFVGHFHTRRALGAINGQSTNPGTVAPPPTPISVQPPEICTLHGLHEFVPQLFIAFAHDIAPPMAAPPLAAYFTHFVSITYAAAGAECGQASVVANKEEGIHILQLTIPRPIHAGDPRVTSLTARQLMIARDFVSLALPYYSDAHPHQQYCGTRDHVRLLILAPGGDGGATDIMSVLICYLIFASEESIENVMDCVKDEAEWMGPEWKNVVQRGIEGLQVIERASTLGL